MEHYHPDRGWLLDIGCATSYFFVVTREHGWEITRIEIVDKAAQIACR
jgi:hypothetical protein